MDLNAKITEQLKDAMRAKDQAKLRSLRAIKAELLLLKTKGTDPTPEDELAALVKMAKQRRDSIAIFNEQNRQDLSKTEQEELEVIESFLPKQLSPDELRSELEAIISQTGAQGMKDMGKVMGELKKNYSDSIDFSKAGSMLKELLNK